MPWRPLLWGFFDSPHVMQSANFKSYWKDVSVVEFGRLSLQRVYCNIDIVMEAKNVTSTIMYYFLPLGIWNSSMVLFLALIRKNILSFIIKRNLFSRRTIICSSFLFLHTIHMPLFSNLLLLLLLWSKQGRSLYSLKASMAAQSFFIWPKGKKNRVKCGRAAWKMVSAVSAKKRKIPDKLNY